MNAYDKALNEIKNSCLNKKGDIDFVKLAYRLDVMLFEISMSIPASGEVFNKYAQKYSEKK